MIKVIVNADDFGLDENRTRAILAAYQQGWISATTVMANMPWFEQAIAMAKNTRLYDNIGLHLNFTEGFPLTDAIRNSRLFCDESGRFSAAFHNDKLCRLVLPAFERHAVAEEAEAQFAKYRASGLTLFHLDSHHHAHTDLSVARIVLPIAKSYGFKTVRLSRNFGAGLTMPKRIYKAGINRILGNGLMLNADFFGCFNDVQNRYAMIPDDCVFEVMTHPLYMKNGDLSLGGELTEFGGDSQSQASFWRSPPDGIVLCDYQGVLR